MMDDNLKVTAQSAAHSDTVDSVTSNVAHNDSNDSEQMSIDNDVSNSSSSSTTSSRHEPSSVPSSDQNSSNDVDADLPAFSNGRSFDSPSFSIAQSVDSPVISNGRSFNSPPLSNGRSVDSPVASSSGFNEQDHNRNQHRNNQNHHERRGFNQRRNLKSMEDQSVDAEVLQARREEEDRLKRLLEAHNRQRQQLLHQQQQLQRQQLQQHLQQHQSDEIVLSSDDEVNESNNLNIHHTAEVNATRTLNQLYSNMTPQTLEPKFIASSASSNFIHTETIDLSDGEEDVRQSTVLGERGMLSGAKEIPENGLHTDDLLNTKDSFGRVLVNVAHPENEPDLLLSPHLSNIVKPHQIGGVRFLYDCVVESIEKYRTTSGLGCILAHSMGLGKTLQTIAFIEVFLRGTGAKHVLCIVPVNTIQNWMSEFEMWLPRRPLFSTPEFEKELADEQEMAAKQEEGGYPANQGSRYRSFSVFSLSECKTQADRARELMKWRKEGGVMFMGYEIYRAMLDEQALRNSISKSGSSICSNQAEALIDKIRSIILDPGPDLVVCDEGHRIKNAKAAVSKALKEIRTKRRIVLTGYPLQNNLLEYWCMVDFVRPGYLGKI